MTRGWARSGLGPRAVVAIAALVVVWMFFAHDDHAGQPDAPRGTGTYLPILARGDGHMLFLMARSTAFDLDWSFANDLARFGDPWLQPRNTITGRAEIPHPIGPALIWTPLMWAAQAGAIAGNAVGADIPLHGYTEWHQRFVLLSSALAAILAVVLGMVVARRFIGGAWAPAYAAAAVLLGTSVTYYAAYMPSYGHALDAGACAAFLGVWALTLGRWTVRRWVALGALLGVAMLIRVQDAALGIVVAIEIGGVIVADLRRRAIDWRMRALVWLAGGAIVVAVALVVFAPQVIYWYLVYGDATGLPHGPRYVRLGSPMILELLYAPRNGWFSTTPLAYLATIGLALLPRGARLLGIALAAALAIQVYLNSAILDWWAMSSFGQRRMCSMTLVLVIGLAAVLWRCGRIAARARRVPVAAWHAVAVAGLAPLVAWNLWRVAELDRGKAAPSDLEPSCCAKVPERLRRPLQWIYDRIGNPFQFPASVYFAYKHGVEIQRWDHAVGNYPLIPGVQALRDSAYYRERGAWRIGFPLAEPYLIGGRWSAVRAGGGKSLRWTLTPQVRVLVPNLLPSSQRFHLQLAPGGATSVTVRWDGAVVAGVELAPGWQPVTFEVADLAVGDHELTIEASVGRFAGAPGWPMPTRPVGVAVSLLEVELVPP